MLVFDIVTVVVSHTETVPFQILRCLQRFRESVCCVRLRRFLDHRQLSALLCRLRPQESCFNVLKRSAPLSLDDAAGGWASVQLSLLSDNNSCSTSAELCITVGRGESETGVVISRLITPTSSVRSQRNNQQSILSQCKDKTPTASWDKMA